MTGLAVMSAATDAAAYDWGLTPARLRTSTAAAACTRGLWGDEGAVKCANPAPHDPGPGRCWSAASSQPHDSVHDTEARQEDQR